MSESSSPNPLSPPSGTRKRRAGAAKLDDHAAALSPSTGSGAGSPEGVPVSQGSRGTASSSAPSSLKKRHAVRGVQGSIHHMELINFKSYKGTQMIGPFKPFQAIVGPNGAGKSNLMDAISFVLGVRSQHLRSAQLRDLIHRPEGSGEPDYGAGVVLVFDPVDGERLRFERTISPRGVSTYKVNGRTVAWAKYNAQLQELGILVHARNFLVFQGDVESIASKTPAELALLIEQVSGSVELKDEYEALKRERDRAEENTIYNFNRKKTLKAEKKQYKQQKEEAEAWQELTQEKRDILQEQAMFQLFHVSNELELVSAALTAEQEEEDAIGSRKSHISTTIKARKRDAAKAHRAVLAVQKKLSVLGTKKNKAKPGLVRLKAKMEHVAAKITDKRAALARKKDDTAKQAAQLSELQGMLKEVERLARAFEESLPEALRAAPDADPNESFDMSAVLNASSRLDEALDAEQLAEYHELKQAAAAETGTLTSELSALRRKFEDETSRLTLARNKVAEVSGRMEELRSKGSGLEERLRVGTAFMKETEAELEIAERKAGALEAKVASSTARMEELTGLLQDTQSKLEEASAHARKSTHEAKVADALESMKRLFPGVHGKVVHLCATQPKYQVALTVAMGRYVDAIVVDTQATAIECIEYMSENRVGTATFLPLNALRLPKVDERFRSLGGTASLALDIIEYEDTYGPAFQFILGNTVVCQGMDEARVLAFGKGKGAVGSLRKKVVTWDGTKITKSGLITGGTGGDDSESAAALWSEKRVAQYRAARTEYETELAALAQSRSLRSQAAKARNEVESLKSKLEAASGDMRRTGEDANDVRTELASLEGSLASLAPTVAALEAQVSESESGIARLEAEIGAVEDRIFGAFSEAVGVSSIRELEASALAEAQAAAKKRLSYAKQRSDLRNQIAYVSAHDDTAAISELEGAIASGETELEKLRGELEEAEAKLGQLEAQAEELKGEVEAARSKEEEVNGQIKVLKADETRLAKEHAALVSAITTSQGQAEALLARRAAIFQRATVEEIPVPLRDGTFLTDAHVLEAAEGAEVEVDFSSLARVLKAVDRETEKMAAGKYAEYDAAFEDRLRSISKDIETMAPNMKAIERLDDLAAKFKQTSAEFDSAREASRIANDRFLRVQRLRTDRFRDAFDHISQVIDDIYKELTRSELNYTGGTAYLTLESPDEPYLSGVKFNAMPPNKRFRNMDALSGGEKTVSALALLFAIHSYRPSPFFVLDEIDSALDAKNVKRVAEYIRTRSADFQCVVISLKDTFFDKADALVGIYRQREGDDEGDVSEGRPTFSQSLTLDLRAYA